MATAAEIAEQQKNKLDKAAAIKAMADAKQKAIEDKKLIIADKKATEAKMEAER